MWYLVLIAVAVVIIIVVVVASSSSGRQSHAESTRLQVDGFGARQPDQVDEWQNHHHDADGTPYGAMDAEFEDWG